MSKTDALYKGVFQPPPATGPAAQRGKNVWWLSCGQQYEACADGTRYAKEAAGKLGWNLTVFDDGGSTDGINTGLRQAISARAEGIAGQNFDCSQGPNPLAAAKAAGIPVVVNLALGCDQGGGTGQPLDTPITFYGFDDANKYTADWAGSKADYVIAKTAGKAQVIDTDFTVNGTTQEISDSFERTLATCGGCAVVKKITFTVSDVPNFAGYLSQALAEQPRADVVHLSFDSMFGMGIVPVIERIRATGRQVMTIGGECSRSNLGYIRAGIQTACLAFPYQWLTWATMDTLNRKFAGQPSVNEGGGHQWVDQGHNLPADGQDYQPTSIDYTAAYEKVWSGQ